MTSGVRLPPGSTLPRPVQGAVFVLFRRQAMARLRRRYGPSFTVELPVVGPAMVISEPALAKALFQAPAELVGNPQPNLGRVLGDGSIFGLEGAEHLRRRKLLVPPFHGRRMKAYEATVEEEVRKETASWRDGVEFASMESMMRITLNVILRTVFGAEGEEFEQLRRFMPPMIKLGSRLATLPYGTNDFGPWSPGGRLVTARRRFAEIVDSLAAKALADPGFEQRQDVLSLLLQARYEDGAALSRSHLCDEMLTLVAAGHETTATTLAWAFERLRRHPSVLHRLQREVDEGGSALRQATILEVQRTRPVIEATARRVVGESFRLGDWVLPRGYSVVVAIGLLHNDDSVFPDALRFDPDRFVHESPDLYSWVPFGGGARRCLGAAFATMEMDVALRTVLQDFEIGTTYRPDERHFWRGVAVAPADGGRLVVHRRAPRQADAAHAVTSAVAS